MWRCKTGTPSFTNRAQTCSVEVGGAGPTGLNYLDLEMLGFELRPDLMEPSFGSVSEGTKERRPLAQPKEECGYSIGKNEFMWRLLSPYCVPGTVLDFMIWSKLLRKERKKKNPP